MAKIGFGCPLLYADTNFLPEYKFELALKKDKVTFPHKRTLSLSLSICLYFYHITRTAMNTAVGKIVLKSPIMETINIGILFPVY